MEHIIQPEQKIPVAASCDVLVCGSGPAGFAAAVCAARQGADTILVEQCGQVGGVATVGLMSHWTGNTQGGFYEELLDRSQDNPEMRTTIDPEKLKTVMLQMLEEAGVRIKLYTFCSDVIMDGDTVKGIITESKSGRQAILAKCVIDATGDGDVAAKAGVPYQKGREDDGVMQPMTLMFKIGNVDTDKAPLVYAFEHTCDVPAGDIQTLGRQHISFPAGHVLIYPTTKPGVLTLNMTNIIGVDGTSADDLTRAEITCRKQMDEVLQFMREYVPGCENAFIMSSASLIGVRETRHLEGMSQITAEDILDARVFDDWAVTRAHFNFDIHNTKGNGLDDNGVQEKFNQPKGYTIPYGCFVPKTVRNLMFAGRCISGTHLAHSNYRVMPICANMGQSVGIAAAMCVEKNISPQQLDVKQLQEQLKKQGVEI